MQDSTERMEHETYGKTAEDNLQSDDAAELAGAPSEKDEAKEVNFVTKCRFMIIIFNSKQMCFTKGSLTLCIQ